jgi:DNA replication protein DnaD
MKSWIKIDREITSHWIFDDPWKFRNWIDLLTLVNHTEQKINIKGVILTCKRGETLCSLDSFAKRWNCDKSKVRRFFKLLESDSMIELKSEHITTRLTICKYDTYQSARHADETQVKRKRNASETQVTPNKNEKNENNDKNEEESLTTILSDSSIVKTFDFKKNLLSLNVPENIVNDWIKVRKAKKAVNTEIAFNKIVNEIAKAKITPGEAIKLCVERSWSGFQSDWYTNQNKSLNTPKEYEPNAHVLKIINRLHKDGGITTKQAEIARTAITNSPTPVNVQQLIDGIERLKAIGDDFDIVNFRDSLRIE